MKNYGRVVIIYSTTQIKKKKESVNYHTPNHKFYRRKRFKKMYKRKQLMLSIPSAPHNTNSTIMDAHATPTRSLDSFFDMYDDFPYESSNAEPENEG